MSGGDAFRALVTRTHNHISNSLKGRLNTMANHGGSRYHGTMLQRKEIALDPTNIRACIFRECGCETNCPWDIANNLPNCMEVIARLRLKRFEGL